MKLCTQTEVLTQHMSEEAALTLLAQAGFDAADLSLFHLQQSPRWTDSGWLDQAKQLGDFAREQGVPILQAHAPFAFPYHQADFETDILPVIRRGVEIAAAAGAKHIVVHPVQHGQLSQDPGRDFELNLTFYGRLVDLAQRYETTICVENMWSYDARRHCIDHDVCSRPEEFCHYVDGLRQALGPHFAACLDLGHAPLVGVALPDMIQQLGPRIKALHIHDNNYHEDSHTLPGHSELDLAAAFRALGQIDYDGLFTLEADNFFIHQAAPLFPAALCYMRQVSAYYRDLLLTAKTTK
ncbi:MAG: sugar phosphate isomerase/epimerase [Oscillospiraceae bacterium]|nr:sugar phosphate isomerase/epimerase [Oscillospiraceae bacterium]MDD4368991.1 sugar phosphate isomerase/epimerase [Oscillospiraceae bacterium]